MRPSTNAVVAGLPKSWTTAPSITRHARGRDRDRRCAAARRRRPSACAPRRRLRGATRDPAGSRPAPAAPARAGRRCRGRARAAGRSTAARACSSSFSTSPQMRSAGRSSSGMARHSANVAGSSVQLEARRELQRAQHAQAVVAERPRIDDAQHAVARGRRGRRTDRGSLAGSGSHAMALMVKSRRRAASSDRGAGSPITSKPLWPRPTFDSRRGQRHVEAGDLVDGEALADGVDRAEARRAAS